MTALSERTLQWNMLMLKKMEYRLWNKFSTVVDLTISRCNVLNDADVRYELWKLETVQNLLYDA